MRRNLLRASILAVLASCLALVACQGESQVTTDDGANDNNAVANNVAVNNTTVGANNIRDPDPPHSGGDPNADPHPNLQSQPELFECSGEPSSSPMRVRRITPAEWARAVYEGQYANRIPFLADSNHAYTTYSRDETIDAPTLQEILRVTQGIGSSWESSSGNSYPRLAIMRNSSPAKDATICFQNQFNGPRNDDPDDACIRSFLNGLLEYGIYFRPPSDDEVEALVPFVKARLAEEERVDGSVTSEARARTIRLVARAAWMTPGAIFRPELGGEPAEDGRRKLTDWELGLALTYAIGNTSPGQSKEGYNSGATHITLLPEVRQAMEAGTISDPETISAIVRYHMAGAGLPEASMTVDGVDVALDAPIGPSKDYQEGSSASTIEPFYEDQYWMSRKLEGFFHQWLGHADVYGVFKDTPEATSAYTSAPERTPSFRHRRYMDLAYNNSQLPRLLDNMIARIVAEDQDVLKKLLTTRTFLLPEGGNSTAENAPYKGYIYNIDIDDGGTLSNELSARWVEMPADERAGVLTHPAWLAAHAGNFENDPNPIYRGKWVWENLLCGWIDDLPVGVNAMLDPATDNLSTRDRFDEAGLDQGYCANCHGSMNPFGYAFETYNHAGFMRVDDHGAAPNGAATLQFTPLDSNDGKTYAHLELTPGDTALANGMQVNNAIEMMEVFAESRHVKQCFIRHSFRYFMGRDESPADACTLTQMETAYDDSGGSMIDMLIALFQSDTFQYRHLPQDMEESQ